jgi:hypothetical protein
VLASGQMMWWIGVENISTPSCQRSDQLKGAAGF